MMYMVTVMGSAVWIVGIVKDRRVYQWVTRWIRGCASLVTITGGFIVEVAMMGC